MFGALLLEWECSSVAIKPPTRSGGLGVVRLSGPEDLYIFADALRSCTPRLPAGTLEQQPLPVTLPLQLPELLVVEPWIETDAVSVAEGGEVQWAGVQRWVEVTVGLIGELVSVCGRVDGNGCTCRGGLKPACAVLCSWRGVCSQGVLVRALVLAVMPPCRYVL